MYPETTYYPEFTVYAVCKFGGKLVATCKAFIEELDPVMNIMRNENPGCRVYYTED